MTRPPEEVTVLLADDHGVVRQGCRRLLESASDIRVVGEAATGEMAVALYAELSPDVLMLDISLPDIDGIDVLRRILAKDAAARVLIFSMYEDETTILRALEAGAIGYLTKSGGTAQLLEAVRCVASGQLFVDTDRATALLAHSITDASEAPLELLSPREFQLFQYFAEGWSVAEIAAALFISPKTVAAHHGKIMKKLKLKNTAQLVRMAIRHRVIEP